VVVCCFRNSKLTYLLQNALGGNARAMMIFTVCPTNMTSDETLFTLQFASRIRNIQLGAAHKNVNMKNLELSLKNMRNELKEMKKKKLHLEELLNESRREQKKTFDKITLPLENKIKTLEEAKKVNESMALTLTKSLTEHQMKIQEDKVLRQQLAHELDYSQQRIKQFTQQFSDFTLEITKLNGVIKKRDEELHRLQQQYTTLSSHNHHTGTIGSTGEVLVSPRTVSPRTGSNNIPEKKVMFAENHHVVSPSSLSTPAKSNNVHHSHTSTVKSTPQSVLKRSVELPIDNHVVTSPTTTTTTTSTASTTPVSSLKSTSKDNVMSTPTPAVTTPSTTKSRTPVMSKVASLFQRSSSQSPGPTKVNHHASSTTPAESKPTPYQRVLRAISPGMSSSGSNNNHHSASKASTATVRNNTPPHPVVAPPVAAPAPAPAPVRATPVVIAPPVVTPAVVAVIAPVVPAVVPSVTAPVAVAAASSTTTTATVATPASTTVVAQITPVPVVQITPSLDPLVTNTTGTAVTTNTPLNTPIIAPIVSSTISPSISPIATAENITTANDTTNMTCASTVTEGMLSNSLEAITITAAISPATITATVSNECMVESELTMTTMITDTNNNTTTMNSNTMTTIDDAITVTGSSADITLEDGNSNNNNNNPMSPTTTLITPSLNASRSLSPPPASVTSGSSSFSRISSVLARSEEALRRHQLRMEKKREAAIADKFKKM